MNEFNKVVGVGMSKTGTTTLGHCFEILGLMPHVGFVRAYKARFKRNADLRPILKAAARYRSFEDSPWYLMYKELDAAFPGSKFILTLRKDSLTHARSSWAHGVSRGIRRGDPTAQYLQAKATAYEQHNAGVLRYFKDRPNDLLVVCWEDGDGWERLCEFLGTDVPGIPLPHANSGDYGRSSLQKRFVPLWSRLVRNSFARERAGVLTTRRAIDAPIRARRVVEMVSQRNARFLEARAAEYFGHDNSGGIRVRLVKTSKRRHTEIHEFELILNAVKHQVLAKTPEASLKRPRAKEGRPYLAPSYSGDSGLMEFHALSLIEKEIGRLDDSRFGTIRVLGYLTDPHTIFMEKSGDRPLRRLMPRVPPSARRAQQLSRVLRNAGAWLREYHRLPPLEHTRTRTGSRGALVDAIERFSNFLVESGEEASLVHRFRRKLVGLVNSNLPDELPLGMSHGDFAPRNILVGPFNRITVCDTRARWYSPIYEDIGYFSFAIRSFKWHVVRLSCGFPTSKVDQYQSDFLAGYFEHQPAPTLRICIFEGLCLLDKWVSLVHRRKTSGLIAGYRSNHRLFVFRRFAKCYFNNFLRQL